MLCAAERLLGSHQAGGAQPVTQLGDSPETEATGLVPDMWVLWALAELGTLGTSLSEFLGQKDRFGAVLCQSNRLPLRVSVPMAAPGERESGAGGGGGETHTVSSLVKILWVSVWASVHHSKMTEN